MSNQGSFFLGVFNYLPGVINLLTSNFFEFFQAAAYPGIDEDEAVAGTHQVAVNEAQLNGLNLPGHSNLLISRRTPTPV